MFRDRYAFLLAEGGRFGKGLSPKTVRNTHTVLRKALSDDRTEYQTWSSDELRTFSTSSATIACSQRSCC